MVVPEILHGSQLGLQTVSIDRLGMTIGERDVHFPVMTGDGAASIVHRPVTVPSPTRDANVPLPTPPGVLDLPYLRVEVERSAVAHAVDPVVRLIPDTHRRESIPFVPVGVQ